VTTGTIVGTIRLGTTWQLLYDIDGNGLGIVNFDRGPFAAFYRDAAGRDLCADHACRDDDRRISQYLKGVRVSVKGERPTQVVRVKRY